MRHVRPSALALALLLLFSLTACKPAADQPSAAPSQAPGPTQPPRMGSAFKGPFHLIQVPDGLLGGQ